MWEDKTVKQLLTEPFNVQKKQGYYSYDHIRQMVLTSCLNLSRLIKKDVIKMTGGHFLDEVLERLEWAIDSKDSNNITNFSNVFGLLMFLFKKNKNIFFLDENLLNTFCHTKLPNNFSISRVFLDECLILLPKSSPLNLPCFVLTNFAVNPYNYSIFSPCLDFTQGCLGSTGFPFPLNHNIFLVDENKNEIKDYDCWQNTSLNFLLWQQSVHDKGQEVIELDAPTRKMGFGKNSKQLIVPRVIGEGYKPKVIRNYESTGSHASPTTHWRSGHWRWQPFGKKEDQKYKTIWIEPVLVNA